MKEMQSLGLWRPLRPPSFQALQVCCYGLLQVITVMRGFIKGVYLESVLKVPSSSLWIRNIQFGMTAIPLAACGLALAGAAEAHGVTCRYSDPTIFSVINQV